MYLIRAIHAVPPAVGVLLPAAAGVAVPVYVAHRAALACRDLSRLGIVRMRDLDLPCVARPGVVSGGRAANGARIASLVIHVARTRGPACRIPRAAGALLPPRRTAGIGAPIGAPHPQADAPHAAP
jgi:hypothetical protein